MDIKLQVLALVIGFLVLSVPTSGIPGGYNSDSIFEGVCPNVTVMQNFNREQFYGNWHEITRIEHDLQRSTDCVTLDFEKLLTGIAGIQFESQFLSNNSDLNRNGIAFVRRPADNQGEFDVVWEADQYSDYDNNTQWFRFRIIETDYTSFAIMYDCNEYNATFATDFFWVLSRNRELATDAQTRVDAFRDQWNITTGVRDTEQGFSVCNSSGALFISWLLVIAAIGLIKIM
ncbi:apolipoprotein D-like [Bradysia coprophila]|uniref:apolipoprotein D-like n=1 Tax=Bradysia coprophila TaxID=38358 RepID=UPI00187DD9D0|nr:apolipoprotein D-like [Bradysia coprophila]